MRKVSILLLSSVGAAFSVFALVRSLRRNRSIPDVHLTTTDLDFPQVSQEEIVSERLVDLNEAPNSELSALGLDDELVQRIIENRPYRSKLELVSRIIVPEALFADIRDKVAVSQGRDPIKVA